MNWLFFELVLNAKDGFFCGKLQTNMGQVSEQLWTKFLPIFVKVEKWVSNSKLDSDKKSMWTNWILKLEW